MESEVRAIPKLRRVFRNTKANLDALTGLRDGALGYGTDTTILYRQNGDGAANWEAITGLPTKEFFVPIFAAEHPVYQGGDIIGAGDFAYMALLVPQDFTAITDIEIIIASKGNYASMNFVITTYYGAYNGGEVLNVHNETASPRDIGAVTANYNVAHSISDLVDVAALAAGDLLAVTVEYDATAQASNAYVRGLRLKYT